MPTTRLLIPGDEPLLEAFLVRHADSSMFLRSNLRAVGLVDRGEPLQGTYVARFDAAGEITDVACIYWNGNLMVQAPSDPGEISRAARAFCDRPMAGILGPWGQVLAARTGLGLDAPPARRESKENLFSLPLADLVVPDVLTRGNVECRRSRDADLDLSIQWRMKYCIEILGSHDTPETRASIRTSIELAHRDNSLWILFADGRPASTTAFNARLPDCVQVGGVYTPPELRARGYARAAVAQSLLDARADGATRAILFADDPHAQQAYRALGFREIGDYGIILFETPQ